MLDSPNKTEDKEARDRTALVFVGSIAEGECNTQIEAVAGVYGITIDEAMLIPWEWIDRARLAACPAGSVL